MGFWDSVGKGVANVGKYAKDQVDMMQSMKNKSDSELERIISSWSSSELEKTVAKAELKKRNEDNY